MTERQWRFFLAGLAMFAIGWILAAFVIHLLAQTYGGP